MEEYLKYFSSMGIGGILALFIYWQARKDAELHADVIRGYHEQEKGRTEMLVQVVKENTLNTAQNNVLLNALHRRLDREEYEKENGK